MESNQALSQSSSPAEEPSTTTSVTNTDTMASQAPPPMNPWEAQALAQPYQRQRIPQSDSLFHPELYCPSGWDLITILMQVRGRPHPTFDLGPIDCSVSMTLCDLEQPDTPIVYATDAFYELTGYSEHEVIGKNCRFLQTPYGVKDGADKASARLMASAIRNGQEIQLKLWNWKKNGQNFLNILSIIPILIDGHRYAVGLQCET